MLQHECYPLHGQRHHLRRQLRRMFVIERACAVPQQALQRRWRTGAVTSQVQELDLGIRAIVGAQPGVDHSVPGRCLGRRPAAFACHRSARPRDHQQRGGSRGGTSDCAKHGTPRSRAGINACRDYQLSIGRVEAAGAHAGARRRGGPDYWRAVAKHERRPRTTNFHPSKSATYALYLMRALPRDDERHSAHHTFFCDFMRLSRWHSSCWRYDNTR